MITGGKAIIVVGATGSGKSTFVKRLIAPVDVDRLHVYDVNREYFPDEPLPDIDDFLLSVSGVTESILIFEEATVFFSNRGSNKMMRKLLVGKRHSRNVVILLFHSVRAIPFYIFDLCNFVVLFHTNDEENIVREKFELLLPAFNEVKNKRFKWGEPLENYYKIIPL